MGLIGTVQESRFWWGKVGFRPEFLSQLHCEPLYVPGSALTIDDKKDLHYLKDPKLWELWYIPYGIYIINRSF